MRRDLAAASKPEARLSVQLASRPAACGPAQQCPPSAISDNLRAHKIDGVAAALRAAGAKLRYLPAYSPDLNPIEMVFSKLKGALRKGAARTVKALMKLVGKLVKAFAPDECANYFRHAGYG